MSKQRTVGYRKYVKRDTVPEIYTIYKNQYLYELIEECLHNIERECDLVRDEEKLKKLEKSKEM